MNRLEEAAGASDWQVLYEEPSKSSNESARKAEFVRKTV